VGAATKKELVWAGVDVGKTHHWVCVVDGGGTVLLSRKAANDQTQSEQLVAAVSGLAEQVVWAVDIVAAPAALLLTVLALAAQRVKYASSRLVSVMSHAYPGEGKTDVKDAYVIAETARRRRDLPAVAADSELIRELELLSMRRGDLVADRVRMLNRLRDLMTSVFPSLEREFNLKSSKGALVLLTGFATPLRQRRVRDSAGVAARAVAAARAQDIALPGLNLAATIINETAGDLLALDERIKAVDTQLAAAFDRHPQAAIIASMPGFGRVLGAALLVAAADLTDFPTAGHLAAAAGLVPVPNDSGRRSGNLHRPRRYNRPLRRVLYLAAQTSMIRPGPTATTTRRNALRAAHTPRPSSPWLAAASMPYGHCCARTGPGKNPHHSGQTKRLDNQFEIPSSRPAFGRLAGTAAGGR
jgi:transposase